LQRKYPITNKLRIEPRLTPPLRHISDGRWRPLDALPLETTAEDARRAGEAIASFLHKSEESVTLLQEKRRAIEPVDQKRLGQRIADLDAGAFETRATASRELIRLGERAEVALRRELTNRPTLEVRRRIDDILSKLEPGPLPPERLQTLRAIEVLEHVGTPAMRRCLEALSKGATDARRQSGIAAAGESSRMNRDFSGRVKP
jgi:hypothetical protein